MPPQNFEFKFSYYYLILFIIAMLLTVVSIFLLPFGFYIKLGIFLLCFVYGFYILKRYILFHHPKTIHCLAYYDGQWSATVGGVHLPVVIHGSSTIMRWLIILIVQDQLTMANYKTLIFADSLSQEAFRKLILLLKFG